CQLRRPREILERPLSDRTECRAEASALFLCRVARWYRTDRREGSSFVYAQGTGTRGRLRRHSQLAVSRRRFCRPRVLRAASALKTESRCLRHHLLPAPDYHPRERAPAGRPKASGLREVWRSVLRICPFPVFLLKRFAESVQKRQNT